MKQIGDVRIGISGWRYKGWRDSFYPRGLKQAAELQFASSLFQSIEINGTHYSLQSLDSWRHWYAETPADFIFSVKGARYLTHLLRFRDDSAQVASANFFAQGLLALNEKLGPILWQFPPSFRFEPAAMERFLRFLPRDTAAALSLAKQHDARVKTPYVSMDRKRRLRHAVEIRHASFMDPAFIELLRQYDTALVVSDSTESWPLAEDVTADFVYIRLHGTESRYSGAYADEALDDWAARIDAWRRGSQPADARLIAPHRQPPARARRDVYCYFDNDAKTHAPFDAQRLIERLGLQAVRSAA
ncbi:uncharacterized protein YecE (DUF72 family) [Paraburkholderia sp. BL18I3N2]|uniref:DUF72 domain-containing protein n=1 Tax=Paraburkholderia sp. BL18I3N2 TaxID=1938799 RepID=UPI000D058AD5|nr:DUF72 domain-containing protein [Paraburkholderia sp. BL18I3N2]PRX27016.1 uncharacterized protein YecE (DUF72 family) [Paraburkholderia sp. BL18I3N2]